MRVAYVTGRPRMDAASIITLAIAVVTVAVSSLARGGSPESLSPILLGSLAVTLGLYAFELLLSRGSEERLKRIFAGFTESHVLLSRPHPVEAGLLRLEERGLTRRVVFEPKKALGGTARLPLHPTEYRLAVGKGRVEELALPAYRIQTGRGAAIVAYAAPFQARVEPETLTLQLGEIMLIVQLTAANGGVEGHISLAPEPSRGKVRLMLGAGGVWARLYEGSGSGLISYKPLSEPLVIVGWEKDIARPEKLAATLEKEAKGAVVSGTGTYRLWARLTRTFKRWEATAEINIKPQQDRVATPSTQSLV